MIRTLLVCCVLAFTTGCIIPIPHARRCHPVAGKKLQTSLFDSETGQPITNAQVILVLARTSDYVPDSSGAPKRPKIVVDKFDRLGKLGYTEGGVWIWPFAFGTLYARADIFIYKDHYEPVAFNHLWSNEQGLYYPEAVKMNPCDPRSGKEMAVRFALGKIEKEEWKGYARRVLERELR